LVGGVERAFSSPGGGGGIPVAAPSGMEAVRAAFVQPIERSTALLALAILGLNLVDGFATLRHLHHGAEELNPFMQLLLRHGAQPFLLVKHALASIGVLGIAMHGQLRAARFALWLLFPLYLVIVVYQIVLFAIIR
jgi:hypothetical protein